MKNDLCILHVFITLLFVWTAQGANNHFAAAEDSKAPNVLEPKQPKTEDHTQLKALEDETIKARFKEVELVTLLRMIARKTGDSIIIDGDVKGKVSIDFNEIMPEEALRSVLDIGQLEMVEMGQVMLVRPKKNLLLTRSYTIRHINITDLSESLKRLFDTRAKLEVDANTNTFLVTAPSHVLTELDKLVKQLDVPQMLTRSFTVRHINIMDLSESLKRLFDTRAILEVDTNTNTFLVTAPSHVLTELDKLVKQLDVPQKQVMIEAAIMEVSLDDETKLGVNLAAVLNSVNLNAANLSAQGLGFAADPTTLPNPEGLFGEGNFFVGKSNRSIDILLEALQTVTDTTVLSHPKVLSVSGQEAEIIVGQKLGFKVTTRDAAVTQETVEFLEVGTQLKFTPIITENNDVIMDIHPEVSDGSISEDGLPNENTTEITSRVRVKNGQTIVLGGLIRKRQQKLVKRVPILGSIPFLGVLFRRTVDTINRSEILVFMTPRVVQDGNGEAKIKKEIDRIRKLQKQGLKNAPPASGGLLFDAAERERAPLDTEIPKEDTQ